MNTTAVIVATYLSQSTRPFIESADFPKHLRDGGSFPQHFRQVPVEEHAGGANSWSDHSSGVFAAEFDYVSGYDLMAWFRKIPWGSQDVATLTVHHEDNSVVVVVVIGRTVAVVTRSIGVHGDDNPEVLVAETVGCDWLTLDS